MDNERTPGALGSNDGLGLVPERAEFERWATVNGYALRRDDGNPERYHAWVTNTLWNGWQAGSASAYDKAALDAAVAAALEAREFVHAESSRIYARLAGAVRAGADDTTLASLLRSEVNARPNARLPAPDTAQRTDDE